ncbi:MAG: prepilin-type N-terminal cleavage/methylation domain-containing protein [Synergistaceae bacterium]|jgi:prepilin-type N-terminal cleavage/methylation domain-containing protein|nr:prepilin-type N-terminal cleavage/methylation domain-containing protein [Synergistaceae bacterium]
MCQPRKKREGFTLVEVLIVIVIIGILAGSMLLAQASGESSAEAMAILSDLRVMKSGAMLFVMNSGDFFPAASVNYAELLGKYMDHGRIINDPIRYAFFFTGGKWWVGVRLKGKTRVNEIIEDKAQSTYTMALYGSDNILTPPPTFSSTYLYKRSNTVVWTRGM